MLAATPPVRTIRLTPRRSAAFTVLRTSILTAAAWNDAATSAISRGALGRWRLTWSETAVLSPLNEKSGA